MEWTRFTLLRLGASIGLFRKTKIVFGFLKAKKFFSSWGTGRISKTALFHGVWYSEDRASWYILIIKANGMHNFSNLFDKVVYMFRTGPLSIIRSISTLNTVYTAIGNCHVSSILTTLAYSHSTSMTNTDCVYTVLRYSWWWTVDLSKTCRVLYQINLRNSATRWLSL